MPGRVTAAVIICSALLATSLVVAGDVSAESVAGGRIDLHLPIRIVDTRNPSCTFGACGPQTSMALSGGYVLVTVFSTVGAGAAVIHPCGEPATDDSMWLPFDVGETSSVQYATSESMCLTSDVPVHVIVDRHGLVHPTPQPGLQQYVAFDEAVPLYASDDFVGNGIAIRATFDEPPDGELAAVVAVGASALGSGTVVTVHGCGSSASFPSIGSPSRLEEVVAAAVLDGDGDFCVTATHPAAVYVDQLGVLASEGADPTALPPAIYNVREMGPEPGLVPMSPTRVVDTRRDLGALGPMTPDDAAFVGADIAAPWTTALSLNVTATRQATGGYTTVWPCGFEKPETSNLNFVSGVDRANAAVGTLGLSWPEIQNGVDDPGDGGETCLWSNEVTDLVVDVTGRFDYGGGLLAEPITPHRLLDTRNAIGIATRTPIPANGVVVVEAAGRGGVPASGAGAVTVNVTATEAQDHGYLTVWPCDEDRPEASNLNFTRGSTVPNLTNAKLAPDGTLCIYTSAPTHLLVDAGAWWGETGASGFVGLEPDRLLDTRNGIGAPKAPIAASGVLQLQVTGRSGVRDDATAVVMNATVVGPKRHGYATVWPCNELRPEASNLNFAAGDIVANLVTVKLSPAGTVCFFADAQTDLLADVAGFLTEQPTAFYSPILA